MFVQPLIIHVVGAVADTDETYAAYAGAENNALNKINDDTINIDNERNKIAICKSKNMYFLNMLNDFE